MRRHRTVTVLIAVAVLVGLGAYLFVPDFAEPPSDAIGGGIIEPAFSPMALFGRDAFNENCAGCHGASGSGTDQGPPLVHDIYNPGHHPDQAFYRAASQGTPQHHWPYGDMPPQPQVSAAQVQAIIRYVRELQEANGIFYRPHRM